MKKNFLILMSGIIILLSGCTKSCCLNSCNTGNKCSVKTNGTMEPKKEKESLTCSLTNIELKERKKTIEKFKSLVIEKNEIENGMIFNFNGNNDNLREILNLMVLERQCCSFLTFHLTIEKESNPISLTISGPEGTKEFLTYELGL